MTGTVLLTGGSGKTATRIAKQLQERKIPVLLTSRKGQAGVPDGFKGVTFDWFDKSTFANPFNEDNNIDTIYLVLPLGTSIEVVVSALKEFIDLAKAKGVTRFVLLSGWISEKGSIAHGEVHEYLDNIGVDYAVLRPSAFFTNFFALVPTIKEKSLIVTATGKGKVGFISEDDIADFAVEFIASPQLGKVERLIFGPELLSYDEVAEQFSEILGRKITHQSVSKEERMASLRSNGLPELVVQVLASIEADRVALGHQEELYSSPIRAIGKRRVRDFLETHKAAWQN